MVKNTCLVRISNLLNWMRAARDGIFSLLVRRYRLRLLDELCCLHLSLYGIAFHEQRDLSESLGMNTDLYRSPVSEIPSSKTLGHPAFCTARLGSTS